MPDKPYTLHSDGGARGNPGPAAYGYVLRDPDGNVIAKEGKSLGKGTNNFAEYQGVIAGIRRAKGLKAVPLACFLDSELVVKQLNGEYKVKDADIREAFMIIWNLRIEMGHVTFQHVPREQNKDADAMVNEALDAEAKHQSLGI